jgi:hypothetical protein
MEAPCAVVEARPLGVVRDRDQTQRERSEKGPLFQVLRERFMATWSVCRKRVRMGAFPETLSLSDRWDSARRPPTPPRFDTICPSAALRDSPCVGDKGSRDCFQIVDLSSLSVFLESSSLDLMIDEVPYRAQEAQLPTIDQLLSISFSATRDQAEFFKRTLRMLHGSRHTDSPEAREPCLLPDVLDCSLVLLLWL